MVLLVVAEKPSVARAIRLAVRPPAVLALRGNFLELDFPKELFRARATLLQTRGLHVTDAEVLAIAKERDGIAIIDDEVARKTAKVYGISYAGTPYVLVKAVVQGLITKGKAKQAINDMVFAGWRCSVETYAKIMESLEKLGRIRNEQG